MTSSDSTPTAWQLTTAERKRILLDHLFGVDIDTQAVEVTKLSLLLKVLENETQAALDNQLRLFHERALPDLSDNIKCGNSLIGPDFYTHHQGQLFDEDQHYRINAFDWKTEFPHIFQSPNPGFNAVIGNPPWGALFTEPELAYLRIANRPIIVRMIDSFMYFIFHLAKRVKSHGVFGMIVPDVFLYQIDNEKLRRWIIDNYSLQVILNMGDVFEKVTRPTAIAIFRNESPSGHNTNIADFSDVTKEDKASLIYDHTLYHAVQQSQFTSIPGTLFVTKGLDDYSLYHRIFQVPHNQLRELVDDDGIQRGVSPDLKEAFIMTEEEAAKYSLENEYLRPVVTGGHHVKRYSVNDSHLLLIYTTRNDDFSAMTNICRFIAQFKNKITCKEVIRNKHPLFALHRPRKEHIFIKSCKLLGVITGDRIIIGLDTSQYFATDGLFLFGLRPGVHAYFVMGILNSRFLIFLYRLLAIETGRVLAQVKPTIVEKIPIPTLDLSNSIEKKLHDRMVSMVQSMLDLHQKLAAAKTAPEKTALQRRIDATDRRIDQLVYQLYQLTPEEIKIVEEAK